MSDIQDYIKYIINKHKTLSTNPPIHIYINRINNRLVLKIEHEYKLEYQTLGTLKLGKTNNGENVPSLEVVEVILVQCNLVDNQYQQTS